MQRRCRSRHPVELHDCLFRPVRTVTYDDMDHLVQIGYSADRRYHSDRLGAVEPPNCLERIAELLWRAHSGNCSCVLRRKSDPRSKTLDKLARANLHHVLAASTRVLVQEGLHFPLATEVVQPLTQDLHPFLDGE